MSKHDWLKETLKDIEHYAASNDLEKTAEAIPMLQMILEQEIQETLPSTLRPKGGSVAQVP